jgi:hypothetical protein
MSTFKCCLIQANSVSLASRIADTAAFENTCSELPQLQHFPSADERLRRAIWASRTINRSMMVRQRSA